MALFIGVMSGTSLDGIDVAIADFSTSGMQVLAAKTVPFAESLKQDLLKLIQSKHITFSELGQTDIALGYAYSDAINTLIKESGADAKDIIAIGCHGQTIHHAPDAQFPFTIQIGNANVIVEQTGIDTVTDFRQRDMVLGGQGAPLVPAFHQAMFADSEKQRVIVNIGGISNISVLPDVNAQTFGFDTGPGNTLLDCWYQQHHNADIDLNGEWAATGQVNKALLDLMLSDAFFTQPIPKSTGREYFNLNWIAEKLTTFNAAVPAADVQRTLLAVTSNSIANAIQHYAPATQQVYVCGGGAHNALLIQALTTALPEQMVLTTDQLGLAPDWVEACAFAWLAKQTVEHKPGNLPAVTGAKKRTVLGAFYSSNDAS